MLIGQLKFSSGCWGRAEYGRLYGLPVLRALADPEGWLGSCRLTRAEKNLCRGGVVRTLLPPGFHNEAGLKRFGLFPVQPDLLLRDCAVRLALCALDRRGEDPGKTSVALCAPCADLSMARTAAALCQTVRRVVIAAPRGGMELAVRLRRDFGVPIVPPEEGADLALHFGPSDFSGSSDIQLYGRSPELGGIQISAPELLLEDRADLSLLSVLWESGLLKVRQLKIT